MRTQGVCWNKCDPATGQPVDGVYEEGDPWRRLESGGMGALCNHQDCPSEFNCQPSSWENGEFTTPEPVPGGCAVMDNTQGVCRSKCGPETL